MTIFLLIVKIVCHYYLIIVAGCFAVRDSSHSTHSTSHIYCCIIENWVIICGASTLHVYMLQYKQVTHKKFSYKTRHPCRELSLKKVTLYYTNLKNSANSKSPCRQFSSHKSEFYNFSYAIQLSHLVERSTTIN